MHRHFLPRGQYTPECRKGLSRDVSSADEIGIALVVAGDTSKHLCLAVAPIVLTTSGTCSGGASMTVANLRYPSDLTDEEWTHVEPVIPPAKVGGNRRRVNIREVVNGIMYILSTGCQWRAIPKDLPPRSTLFDYLDLWSCDGTLDRMHHTLYVECRKRGDRQASPTAKA
jgi:transposase